MAGFLTRIAVRLGEPEGQLRPRRPSLFEPPATHLALDGVPADGPDSTFDTAVEADAPAAEAPPAVPAAPSRQRRTGRRGAAPGPVDPDHRADMPPEAVDSPETARGASPMRRLAPPAIPAEPPADPAAMLAAPAPRRPGRAIRPAGAASLPQAVPDPATAADPPAPAEARRAMARRRTARPLPGPDDTTAAADPLSDLSPPEPPLATPASGILQAPAVAHIAAVPPPVRTHRGEPEIHVSIGRIEVRAAVAAPAETARAGRPSPVMSLDEYLRARAR